LLHCDFRTTTAKQPDMLTAKRAHAYSATDKGSRRTHTWNERVRIDLRNLRGRATKHGFASAAARLLDTIHSDEVASRIRLISLDQPFENDPYAAYAHAILICGSGRPADAIEWFAKAWSALTERDAELVARIAYEIAYIELARSNRLAAIAAAEIGRSKCAAVADDMTDLQLLAALLEDHAGNREMAIHLYRNALTRTRAFTPISTVRACANLAVALEHVDPTDSLALCELAIALLRSDGLDPKALPGIQNIHGYVLLVQERVKEARAMLRSASAAARSAGNTLIELFAEFNDAIGLELIGEVQTASSRLLAISDRALARGYHEIASWCVVRRAWLFIKLGVTAAAESVMAADLKRVPTALTNAFTMTCALIALTKGDLVEARRGFASVGHAYELSGDALNLYVALLWLSLADLRSGHASAASRSLARAQRLGQLRGFRSSPNWWSDDVERLRDGYGLFESLDSASEVVISSDSGEITIDGHALGSHNWRAGKTGPFVLRRMLAKLASSYPTLMSRDEIADALWPDSDGDSAVRNLYHAVGNLRDVLTHVPGVRLERDERSYRLRLQSNASIASHPH
jgi:tetratricopeptide (TPR) repeat protein